MPDLHVVPQFAEPHKQGDATVDGETSAPRTRPLPPPLSPQRLAAQKRRSDLFDELWEEWAERSRQAAEDHYAYHDCHAGSDLERLLLVPLMFIQPRWLEGGYGGPLDLEPEFTIRPQYPIGPYFVDFAVLVGPFGVERKEFRIAVECDGHYFHDRTKEQATRDKRRDRYLTLHGWRVIRFTETEINADPRGCADQVEELIERLLGVRAGDE